MLAPKRIILQGSKDKDQHEVVGSPPWKLNIVEDVEFFYSTWNWPSFSDRIRDFSAFRNEWCRGYYVLFKVMPV